MLSDSLALYLSIGMALWLVADFMRDETRWPRDRFTVLWALVFPFIWLPFVAWSITKFITAPVER